MAENKDNLEELVGIQSVLLKNTDAIHQQAKEAKFLGVEFMNILNLSKQLNAAITEVGKTQADVNKSFFTPERVKKNADNLVIQQKRVLTTLSITEKGLDEIAKKAYDKAIEYNKVLSTSKKEYDEIEKVLAERALTEEQISKSTQRGIELQAIMEIAEERIEKYTKDKKVGQSYLLSIQKQSVEEAIKLNAENQKANKWNDNLLEKTEDLGKRLGKMSATKGVLGALGLGGGATAIFKTAVESAFKIDTSLTGISNKGALNKEYTDDMLSNYQGMALGTHTLNSNLSKSLVTMTSLLQSQQELQASTEQLSVFTNKSVQDQMYLTKQLGLQADEAAKINQIGLLSSKTADNVTNLAFEQTAEMNKQTGLRISGLEVLKSVAKVEGMLAANYKNDPKLIAAAVVQAKALGISLEQAANASNSLLDFESSISNELEAELLTGKKWNLEKARSLALDGDAAGAAAEMLKNVGSYADFLKQNVIARKAEAKAVGMTADELANSLRSQELMKAVSKETVDAIRQSGDAAKYNAMLNAATNATEMKAAVGRVTEQQKFEDSMTRVREQLGIMANGPMQTMVDILSSLTSNAWALKAVLVGTAAVMASIATSSMLAAFGVSLMTGGANLAVGVAGGIGAIAMGAALFGAKTPKPTTSMQDGLISPSGQIMISTPQGMIKPHANDSVITTTDPGSLLGGGGKSDQLLAAILTELKKPAGVYIDSSRAGTALGMSYSAYA